MYLKLLFPQQTIQTAMVVTDFNFTQNYYNDLSPADNSVRCTIMFNTTIANLIKQNINNDIKCEIKNDDDTNYFIGFLKNNVNFSKATVNGNISIEIVSPTSLFEVQFASDYWYTQKSLSGAVTEILEIVGIDDYNIANLPTKIIPVVHFEKDSEIKSTLTELLYEYGFCFDFDNDGVFICNPLFDEVPATITNVFSDGANGNLIGNVQQTVQERKFDGVSAKFDKLVQKNNQLIFDDSSDHTVAGQKTLYDNESGTYTTYDCTVGEPFYIQSINNWKVGNDSFVITMADPETSYWKGTFTNYGKQGLLTVKNKLQTEQTINTVKIWGSGYFVETAEKSITQDGKNLDDVELDFIFDETNASAFADKLRKYYKYSNFKITLKSYSDFVYGSFCSVSVTGMGTIKGRIVQKRRTLESNLIEYTIEAIDEFEEATIVVETSKPSNIPSAIQQNVIEQVTPMVEEIVEEVVEPVIQTVIVNVIPRYRGKVEALPEDTTEYNNGDWVFLTVATDTEEIGLYKLTKSDEGDEWVEIEYNDDGSNDSYFNAATGDLLPYYTAENAEQVAGFARAYINHLFVNKITIGENGSIQSSNYSEENGTGFLIDYNGDIKANNGYFRGNISTPELLGTYDDLNQTITKTLFKRDVYNKNKDWVKRIVIYIKGLEKISASGQGTFYRPFTYKLCDVIISTSSYTSTAQVSYTAYGYKINGFLEDFVEFKFTNYISNYTELAIKFKIPTEENYSSTYFFYSGDLYMLSENLDGDIE